MLAERDHELAAHPQESPMPEITLTDIARILGRAWRWIAMSTAAGMVVTALVAFSLPDQYEAEGLLLSGGPVGNGAALEGIRLERGAFSAPAIKRITDSDENLRQVAKDLLSQGIAPPETASWLSSIVPAVKDWVGRIAAEIVGQPIPKGAKAAPVDRLRLLLARNMMTASDLESGTVKVRYTDTDPERAAAIANDIMSRVVADRQHVLAQERADIVALVGEQRRVMGSEIEKRTRQISLLRQQLEFDNAPGGTVLDRRITEAARALNAASAELASARAHFDGAKVAINQDAIRNKEGGMVLSPLLERLRQEQAVATQRMASEDTRFGPLHPETIALEGELQRIATAISAENGRILIELRGAVTAAESREAAARRNLDELRKLHDEGIPDRYQVTVQEKKLAALEANFDSMTRLLEYYEIQKGDATGVRVSALAVASPVRSGPHRPMAVIFGGFICFVGSVIVSLFHGMSSGLYASPDRYRHLLGAGDVYTLPILPRRVARSAWKQIGARDQARHAGLQRNLRGLVLWLVGRRGGRGITVAITSAASREGKTLLSTVLARSAAALGFRTLLIDADLLTGMSIDDLVRLKVVRNAGEEDGWKSPVCQIHETRVAGLLVGVAHGYISEIFSKDKGDDGGLRALTQYFDLVIIDTPPLLPVMESIAISRACDLTVMVHDWRSGGIGRLMDAAKRQQMFGGAIDMLVLNRFPERQCKVKRRHRRRSLVNSA